MNSNRSILHLACLFLPCLVNAQVSKSNLPNIVIIYADDLGYGDVGCYNPERGKIPTPHIDRLAAEGMRFTDGHSSSAVCTPSRYTILTGRYHWRSRLQRGIVKLWEEPLITPDRLTIAGFAQQQGYRTACVGKWHLGWDWGIPEKEAEYFKELRGPKVVQNPDLKATAQHKEAWKNVFSKPISGGPVAVGFDEYFGTDVPNWPPYCFIENDRTVGIPSEYGAPILFKPHFANIQGPALPEWSLEAILPELGKRSSEFIEREAKRESPFFLYLSLTSPHTPLSMNEEWQGKSQLNPYADLVMETDAIVGKLLDAIEKSGEAKNTLVLFTSDNGCAKYIGVEDLQENGHFPSGPLRGFKGDFWEGGHRVPFIVRWPEVVAAGAINHQLVHQADLMASLADIVGVSLPKNAGEDSFSLFPLLKGGDKPIRKTAVSTSAQGFPAFRVGKWKYISTNQKEQLFDLESDLEEVTDLASKEPDRVAAMQRRLERLITQGRSNPGPQQANDVRVTRFPVEKK